LYHRKFDDFVVLPDLHWPCGLDENYVANVGVEDRVNGRALLLAGPTARIA
jgi:hypothetical protein